MFFLYVIVQLRSATTYKNHLLRSTQMYRFLSIQTPP